MQATQCLQQQQQLEGLTPGVLAAAVDMAVRGMLHLWQRQHSGRRRCRRPAAMVGVAMPLQHQWLLPLVGTAQRWPLQQRQRRHRVPLLATVAMRLRRHQQAPQVATCKPWLRRLRQQQQRTEVRQAAAMAAALRRCRRSSSSTWAMQAAALAASHQAIQAAFPHPQVHQVAILRHQVLLEAISTRRSSRLPRVAAVTATNSRRTDNGVGLAAARRDGLVVVTLLSARFSKNF